jgi:hypothetical protein
MFKATVVGYTDLPDDVNRDAFETGGVEECYDDYLVVQVDGKTIWCKPESKLDEGMKMTVDLMELAYYLGAVAGVKHEQGYMGGRSLKVLNEGKPNTKIPKFMKEEGK